jgi:D-inositol-3-phosphate glycosyltransferase
MPQPTRSPLELERAITPSPSPNVGGGEIGGQTTPLVVIGVFRPGTGFSRVLQSILAHLPSAYDVHYVGIGYQGPSFDLGGVTVHPCNLHGGDVYGAIQGAALVESLDAPLVFLLHDLWMLRPYVHTLAPLRPRTTVVAYIPLDGTFRDDDLLAPLTFVDRFVTYTHFASKQLAQSLCRLGRTTDVAVIPHGVDTTTFSPLAGSIDCQIAPGARRAARQRLFPHEPSWHDAFIVLNANRPMPRKRIDLTLEGFARFAHGRPSNVKLWLHHAIMNADERASLVALVDGLGLTDRVHLTPLDAPPLSDADLNLVYNACDVGLNTALGEGWGLVSFEHAATGAAQIVPDSSACAELWPGAAELLPTEETYDPRLSPLTMGVTTPAAVAAALDRLYNDPRHLRSLSLAAYRNATQPAYDWDRIAAQWHTLFTEILSQQR